MLAGSLRSAGSPGNSWAKSPGCLAKPEPSRQYHSLVPTARAPTMKPSERSRFFSMRSKRTKGTKEFEAVGGEGLGGDGGLRAESRGETRGTRGGQRGFVEQAAAGRLDELDPEHGPRPVEPDADGGDALDAGAARALGIGGLDPFQEGGRVESIRPRGEDGRRRRGDRSFRG